MIRRALWEPSLSSISRVGAVSRGGPLRRGSHRRPGTLLFPYVPRHRYRHRRHARAADRRARRGSRGLHVRSTKTWRMARPLWAEQRPENWWDAAVDAIRGVLAQAGVTGGEIRGIGLSGQMHGLVLLDAAGAVIRPSLIWCDQRSQPQVDAVNAKVGRENVLRYIANPVLTGFTLPKLLWVRDHEPRNFERARKMLLPKDYVRLQAHRRIRHRSLRRFRDGAFSTW